MYEKVLYGLAGAAGVSVAAWRTMFPWIADDLKIMKHGSKAYKMQLQSISQSIFLIDKFEEHVISKPDKTFIIYEDNIFSYKAVDDQANKVANIARSWGLKVGDTVALFCSNSPEFIWTFLGMLKVGMTVAMVNTSIHAQALSHSVNMSGSSILIVGEGEDLLSVVQEASEGDLKDVKIYVQGTPQSLLPPGFQSFDDLMIRALPVPVDKSVRSNANMTTTCCYIYTSGTTGLPKPTYISQAKAYAIGSAHFILDITENDVTYVVLPLFHSAACMIMWSTINAGATAVLRKKFSASHFWGDVRRYNVTLFQYIGELCRYLLSQKPDPLDGQHKVRAILGNGLRTDIWEEFQSRFRIPLICEFFAATDGNAILFQLSNKAGAVGRMSPFMKILDPAAKKLVKYDYNTAEPIRDKNGRCVEIKPGETGLYISEILPDFKNKPIYKASAEATSKKIIKNAFVDGDEYFNYGDLLHLDKNYFLYFVDRIGDTFRWKGENVSTTEVANTLTSLPFIHDANVYGVTVPGQDGRAGMAALTLNTQGELTPEQLKKIYDHCEHELARYARPIFLRVLREAILTATFKQKKFDIVKEGFNPMEISDPLFLRDEGLGTYVQLTPHVYPKILSSKL